MEHVAVLTRIEGGVAFRAPGVALVLREDHIQLVHWTRSPSDFRIVHDHMTRKLGGAFTIEDIRAVAASGTARRPLKTQDQEAERNVPNIAEPEQLGRKEDEAAMTTTPVEDDSGPSF